MEFRHLVTFCKAAKVLSFSRAAAELRYAQSTVTSHIRSLELELQTELFDRLGGRVQLTEAGRRLLPYAAEILELTEEATARVAGTREPSGTVSVGTLESITSYRLPPLVELFHHRYPQVQLALRPSLCAETIQSLRQGTYDVGFLMTAETRHDGLKSEILGEEPLVLVAAPGNPTATTDGPEPSLDLLRQATLLATEPGCAYRDLFEQLLNTTQSKRASFLEFGTIEAMKRGLTGGLGIGLMPLVTVREEIEAGQLIVLPWQPPFKVYTQLAWRDGKRLSPELELFINESMRLLREPAAGIA